MASRFLLAALVFSFVARAAQPVTTLASFPNSTVYAVQTDAAGDIYVAGFQGTFTKANPFVAKLSPGGQTLYSTTFAGSGFGIAWAIAIDSSGDAYVSGTTNSPNFPVTPGALQTTLQASQQGFVAKLDPTGKIVYATFLGGASTITPGLALSDPRQHSGGFGGRRDYHRRSPIEFDAPHAVPSRARACRQQLRRIRPEAEPDRHEDTGRHQRIGGMIAMDSQGNIYAAGAQDPAVFPLPSTPGAFQSQPSTNACSLPGAMPACSTSMSPN